MANTSQPLVQEVCGASAESLELEELVNSIRDPAKKFPIADKTSFFTTYRKVFTGKEFVDFCVSKKLQPGRIEAISLGLRLQKYGFLHHVQDKFDFGDNAELYRWRTDDPPALKGGDISAEKLSTSCDATVGWLTKKGKIFWNKYWCVLSHGSMYYFEGDKASLPKGVIPIDESSADLGECEQCNPGMYCFNIATKDRIHLFCSNSSKEQEMWMAALVACGAKLQQDTGPGVNANSFFELQANSITGQLVPMSEFTGKVCLVVNVASQ